MNVVRLPEQSDPDTFINRHGAEAYREELVRSLPGIDFVLDLCISQHRDAFGPRGKQEIVDQISALLRRIENRIERSEYVSKVASRLQVAPDLVLQQVRRFRSRKKGGPDNASTPGTEVRPAEALLLNALMDPKLGPLLKPRVDSGLVRGLATQRLVEKILELWKRNCQPDILSLRDALEEESDVDLLEMVSLSSSFVTKDETIILESIRSLGKLQLDEQKRRIREQIKLEEERDPSSPVIDQLLEELQSIEQRRIQLDQRGEPA